MKNKNIFYISIIILLFISIISLVYGFIKISESKALADATNETCINLTQEALTKCTSLSEKLDNSQTYDKAISFYSENIENESSPVLKAYIAKGMVKYALSVFAVEATANPSATTNGIYNDLSDLLTQLDNIK